MVPVFGLHQKTTGLCEHKMYRDVFLINFPGSGQHISYSQQGVPRSVQCELCLTLMIYTGLKAASENVWG